MGRIERIEELDKKEFNCDGTKMRLKRPVRILPSQILRYNYYNNFTLLRYFSMYFQLLYIISRGQLRNISDSQGESIRFYGPPTNYDDLGYTLNGYYFVTPAKN